MILSRETYFLYWREILQHPHTKGAVKTFLKNDFYTTDQSKDYQLNSNYRDNININNFLKS